MRKKFLICTFKTIINNSKRSFTQPIDLLFIFQLQNIHIKRTIFKFHRSAPPPPPPAGGRGNLKNEKEGGRYGTGVRSS